MLVETGFYYLQSRYYDPIVKRFLNADSYGSTGTGFLGYNMFSYCENNPVAHKDLTGHSWLEDAWNWIEDAAEDVWNGVTEVWDWNCNVNADWADFLGNVSSYTGISVLTDYYRWVADFHRSLTWKRNTPNIDGWDLYPLTRENFRKNLQIYTQQAGTDRDAHHVLPVAHETQFRSAGIENIHSPIYGAWVDPTAHHKWSYEYNQRWDTFFRTTTNPTVDQILDYADELAEEFGFEVYYNG